MAHTFIVRFVEFKKTIKENNTIKFQSDLEEWKFNTSQTHPDSGELASLALEVSECSASKPPCNAAVFFQTLLSFGWKIRDSEVSARHDRFLTYAFRTRNHNC